MKMQHSISKILATIELVISGLALFFLVLLTFLGVIMRYVFNSPIIFLQEIQIWCMIWIVFWGGAAAVRTQSHVAIDVLVDFFPDKIRKITEILVRIISIAVLSYLAYYGILQIIQMGIINRTSNILHVPFQIIYSAFPTGCILLIIGYISEIIFIIKQQKEFSK